MNQDTIKNLLELKHNWDGYGAYKFTKSHIDRALELYSAIHNYYLTNQIDLSLLPFIAPCSNNYILFDWTGKKFTDKELEIYVSCYLDAPLEYLKEEYRDTSNSEEEGCFSMEKVNTLLDWLFSRE